jgi:uncharacterized protein (TIGR03790 family)
MWRPLRSVSLLLLATTVGWGQTAANVLVVVNKRSTVSQRIGQYYVHKREIPLTNVCRIDTEEKETVGRDIYTREIEKPIGGCLEKGGLRESVLYIVTTLGVPLRVNGPDNGMQSEIASVDSELTLLYSKMRGQTFPVAGPLNNPFFGHVDAPFRHPNFPMYLVTRLAGYDFAGVQGLIDRSMAAKDVGNFVIDERADNNTEGNGWLRQTAAQLSQTRLVLDDTAKVLYDLKNVIAYASWGSNDPDRHRRTLGFQWLPGAIATEFVSTDGRTFARPPQDWTIGTWKDPSHWFAGSPQTMSADFVHEGVTGVSGHVGEPFLGFCPRPNYVLPAYANGRNLAESYYLGIAGLSWQNIVIGDPLCKLRQ